MGRRGVAWRARDMYTATTSASSGGVAPTATNQHHTTGCVQACRARHATPRHAHVSAYMCVALLQCSSLVAPQAQQAVAASAGMRIPRTACAYACACRPRARSYACMCTCTVRAGVGSSTADTYMCDMYILAWLLISSGLFSGPYLSLLLISGRRLRDTVHVRPQSRSVPVSPSARESLSFRSCSLISLTLASSWTCQLLLSPTRSLAHGVAIRIPVLAMYMFCLLCRVHVHVVFAFFTLFRTWYGPYMNCFASLKIGSGARALQSTCIARVRRAFRIVSQCISIAYVTCPFVFVLLIMSRSHSTRSFNLP